uniref:Nucleotide exchange factor Fes1 domain-containing protein n=1 Tax=Alexandrium catenella TaxID=2925 RepID=A0A7S1S7C8_ALECA
MTELLHWAVENSDPGKLAELMRKYQAQNLTIKDVWGQDTIDALFRDEASDMIRLIAVVADFRNASVSDEILEGALSQLQEYIDQIDNAGNLHGMGGLAPLLDLAVEATRGPEVRRMALWDLGVAAQNNPPVQSDILGLGGLERLAARLQHCRGGDGRASEREEDEDPQYCGKLIFTLSGLIKNNATTQAAADRLGVVGWLFRDGIRHSSTSMAKKSLGLLETVLAQSPELPIVDALPEQRDELSEALLAGVRGGPSGEADLDLAEKALRLVNRLLSLRPLMFGQTFGPRLSAAAGDVGRRCEEAHGPGDELCSGLMGLAGHANLMLTASGIADEEL